MPLWGACTSLPCHMVRGVLRDESADHDLLCCTTVAKCGCACVLNQVLTPMSPYLRHSCLHSLERC